MSIKTRFEYNWGGRPLIIEVGEVAKQANAAAMIYYGDSAVLSVAAAGKKATTLDFFPLLVIYQERLYAAGKIPGGFLRREGRPSENETLTSRLIDRPIRPLFADGFRNEVQLINTVMSSDPTCLPQMPAMFGSSLALTISDIPFDGPIAAVQIGRIEGKLIINPSEAELEISDMDLIVAGTKDAINMVEAGAKEVSEEDMLAAMMLAHQEIIKLCDLQLEIQRAVGKPKSAIAVFEIDADIAKEVEAFAGKNMVDAVHIEEKLARYAQIDAVKDESMKHFDQRVFTKDLNGLIVEDFESKKLFLKNVKQTLDKLEKDEVRRMISVDKIRPDGRKADEIRPLTSRVDVLPRAHGSAMFTRGQTQALSVTTLGALGENQIIDGLGMEDSKRFMLHYNFTPYSVGEVGRYGPIGRREVGHGALGERAILQVLPNEEEFPYTIRVVSEILESNGSTSQASICAGVMSLMAAGVPLKAPVAGIAMGLIQKGSDYTILTDIQGMEDHLGDMDFKVAGTAKGITALQMDIKVEGLNEQILRESLEQARIGRLQILEHMIQTIPTVREELSPYAPKVKMIRINPDRIRDVIGAGGKIISALIAECNDVKIDIEQDGRVFLMHTDMKWIKKAIARIEDITREAKVGEIYQGTVTRIEKFGVFVEIWSGTEGLVHISRLAETRVDKPESVVSLGEQILVKCIGIDDKGRIDLSRKDALKSEASEKKE